MPNIDTVSGIIPPLITPLTDDRQVDEAGLRRVMRHVLDAGVHGGVLGIANIVPGLCVQLYEAAARGDAAQSRDLQRGVTAVSQIFRVGLASPTSMKVAASILGLCGPTVNLPLTEATDDSVSRIRKILEDCEVTGK